jgi:hypothetical protein
MNPIDAAGTGIIAAVPQRVFLSHTSDLGKHTEPGSFVAAAIEAVLCARHAVTDMAYFAARDAAPAACGSSPTATMRGSISRPFRAPADGGIHDAEDQALRRPGQRR